MDSVGQWVDRRCTQGIKGMRTPIRGSAIERETFKPPLSSALAIFRFFLGDRSDQTGKPE